MGPGGERVAAVAATVSRVRAIARAEGETRAALERIKRELIALAAREELFPAAQFPVPAGKAGQVYRLSEDADFGFALYASAGMPGKVQPPHNHTTWAVISGVRGEEHNVFYERTDNRGTPGIGTLRRTGELTVVRGNAVAFLPDDFHTIETTGSEPALHLHLYGRSLERLPERINFEHSEGGRHAVFPASPDIAPPVVAAAAVKAMLGGAGEFAFLDVREEGEFAEAHPLFAMNLPLSRLEILVDALVPRRATPIVLVDAGDGRACRKAALALTHAGYGDVAMLAGGIGAWRDAGYELFSGVNVPSKAFGEFVEHHDGTPRREAAEVKALLDSGRRMVVLDSRPMDEFRAMSIPSGIDCPGAELLHRIFEVAPDPETLVVVNCAGRTRSIIGAQSLINAGVPNEVVALKNGTMGWHLAGLALKRGETRHAPAPSAAASRRAREAADRVAARFGVKLIDRDALARFESDAARTLYRFDVRTPEEYAGGHLPGFRHAAGGQLVQATDRYVATRGARIVLACDSGTRSIMTASWLLQMGWEAYVLDRALDHADLETGPEPRRVVGLGAGAAEGIDAVALKALLDRGEALVVDLATSLRHRDGHIPGAWWAVRGRLGHAWPKLPDAKLVVLTSPDGIVARLAAAEAASLTRSPVRVLLGGTRAWAGAGLPLETGQTRIADATTDVWYRPYDRAGGVEEAMKGYLSWEVDLVAQVERDGDARFRLSPR